AARPAFSDVLFSGHFRRPGPAAAILLQLLERSIWVPEALAKLTLLFRYESRNGEEVVDAFLQSGGLATLAKLASSFAQNADVPLAALFDCIQHAAEHLRLAKAIWHVPDGGPRGTTHLLSSALRAAGLNVRLLSLDTNYCGRIGSHIEMLPSVCDLKAPSAGIVKHVLRVLDDVEMAERKEGNWRARALGWAAPAKTILRVFLRVLPCSLEMHKLIKSRLVDIYGEGQSELFGDWGVGDGVVEMQTVPPRVVLAAPPPVRASLEERAPDSNTHGDEEVDEGGNRAQGQQRGGEQQTAHNKPPSGEPSREDSTTELELWPALPEGLRRPTDVPGIGLTEKRGGTTAHDSPTKHSKDIAVNDAEPASLKRTWEHDGRLDASTEPLELPAKKRFAGVREGPVGHVLLLQIPAQVEDGGGSIGCDLHSSSNARGTPEVADRWTSGGEPFPKLREDHEEMDRPAEVIVDGRLTQRAQAPGKILVRAELDLEVVDKYTQGLRTAECFEEVKAKHVELKSIVAAIIKVMNDIIGNKVPRSKAMKNPETVPPFYPGPPKAYAKRAQDMKRCQLMNVIHSIFDFIREYEWGPQDIKYLRDALVMAAWHPLGSSVGTWAALDCCFQALENMAREAEYEDRRPLKDGLKLAQPYLGWRAVGPDTIWKEVPKKHKRKKSGKESDEEEEAEDEQEDEGGSDSKRVASPAEIEASRRAGLKDGRQQGGGGADPAALAPNLSGGGMEDIPTSPESVALSGGVGAHSSLALRESIEVSGLYIFANGSW
ncbi:hypothetical protein KFL_007950010, partial [Klebsormidium nitens]